MTDTVAGHPAPTLAELERAACEIVDEIVAHRQRRSELARASGEKPTFRVSTAAQLMETPREILKQRDIVADPVTEALKRMLKELGQMIYDHVGSTTALVDVAERIAAKDPNNHGRRMSPIDSAWNYVGSGTDRWHS